MSSISKVLVITNEQHLFNTLVTLYKDIGYTVTNNIKSKNIVLIVIDEDSCNCRNLNSACKKLKSAYSSPIISISSETTDKNISINLCDDNIDDFIEKPIRWNELELRSMRLIDKYLSGYYNNIITYDNFSFNKSTDCLKINDTKISLTPIETKLFKSLIENVNTIVQYDDLIFAAWGKKEKSIPTLSTNIKRLKDKIGKDKIITVRKQGYMLKL